MAMVTKLTNIRFLVLIFTAIILNCCNHTKNQANKIFVSNSLQDSLDYFISVVDSIPNLEGIPTIVYVVLYDYQGTIYVDFDAEVGGLTWPLKDPEATMTFCKGRYKGTMIYVIGNPKYKHLVNCRNLGLSKKDWDFLRKNNKLTEINVPQYHKTYILTLSGEIVDKLE